jgi:DNA-binding MarR family transcriptional regulator
MKPQDLRTLKILEEIEKDSGASQRDLAKKLNISLGLVNSFIKRMSHKGYFKITTIPKNRIRYILTPKGFAEKSRLTYEYIQLSYRFYNEARQKLRKLFQDFNKNGVNRIVFFGASDLAEIAYLSLQETAIKLVAVVDEEKAGNKFFHLVVKDPKALSLIQFDKILITSFQSDENSLEKIISSSVSPTKVESIP